MSNPTCETCRWWEFDVYSTVNYGRCHRNAPEVSEVAGEYQTRWPLTRKDDFCGEHATKESMDTRGQDEMPKGVS